MIRLKRLSHILDPSVGHAIVGEGKVIGFVNLGLTYDMIHTCLGAQYVLKLVDYIEVRYICCT